MKKAQAGSQEARGNASQLKDKIQSPTAGTRKKKVICLCDDFWGKTRALPGTLCTQWKMNWCFCRYSAQGTQQSSYCLSLRIWSTTRYWYPKETTSRNRFLFLIHPSCVVHKLLCVHCALYVSRQGGVTSTAATCDAMLATSDTLFTACWKTEKSTKKKTNEILQILRILDDEKYRRHRPTPSPH